MRFLLDTNVVSEWSKAQPNSQVIEWVERQSSSDLAVSAMTLAEVHYGIELYPPQGGGRICSGAGTRMTSFV